MAGQPHINGVRLPDSSYTRNGDMFSKEDPKNTLVLLPVFYKAMKEQAGARPPRTQPSIQTQILMQQLLPPTYVEDIISLAYPHGVQYDSPSAQQLWGRSTSSKESYFSAVATDPGRMSQTSTRRSTELYQTPENSATFSNVPARQASNTSHTLSDSLGREFGRKEGMVGRVDKQYVQ